MQVALNLSQSMKNSLEYYRNEIDKTNNKLIQILYKRSKFKLNNSLKSEDPFLMAFYSAFLKDICEKGEDNNLDKSKSLDSKISELLYKRISYGEPIARYKELHSLKTENKEREREVLERVDAYAEKIGFESKALQKAFSFIIKSTKDLEHCILNQLALTNTKSQKRFYLTGVKECIPLLKQQAEEEISKMHGKYVAKVTESKQEGSKVYLVQILPEL